ncbi:MAG: hypothetical protein KIH69_008775 [Anaerolineae bacterium]|nr:hypothetical protein [Anaerolineae bacterium]
MSETPSTKNEDANTDTHPIPPTDETPRETEWTDELERWILASST